MKYINIEVPPLPYSIVCGNALYRIGDMHKKRTNTGTYDMIFVVRGELFINEDGVEYALSEGEILILYPDKTHYGYAHSQQETFFYWIHFTIPGKYNYSDTFIEYKQKSSSVFKESKYWISINKYNILSKLEVKEMERIFLRLQTISVDKYQRNTIFHDETLNYIEQQQYFIQMLLMLIPKIDNLRKTNPLAYDIMDYMKKNCHEKIELKTLGQLYNFHPVHIIRCVKKEFNVTPNQLLLQIRIEKAKELLTNTDLSISEIGVEVGIYQTSYFIKNFKKIIGSTPYEFRKALGNF